MISVCALLTDSSGPCWSPCIPCPSQQRWLFNYFTTPAKKAGRDEGGYPSDAEGADDTDSSDEDEDIAALVQLPPPEGGGWVATPGSSARRSPPPRKQPRIAPPSPDG